MTRFRITTKTAGILAANVSRLCRLALALTLASGLNGIAFAQQNAVPGAGAGSVITEEMLLAEYERFKGVIGDKEYHVSHILVVEKDAAQQIIDRLNKGESFSELAKTYSRDPVSARRGGDLGWNVTTSFVREFSKAMKELEPGKYSTAPVRTKFGWHVIEVEETRPLTIPPFEQVKERIRNVLLAEKMK